MKEAEKLLKNGTSMYVAGKEPVHVRKASVFVSKTLKLAIAGLVVVGSWHGLGIGDKIKHNQSISPTASEPVASPPSHDTMPPLPIGVRATSGSLGFHLSKGQEGIDNEYQNITPHTSKADFSSVTGGVGVIDKKYDLPIEVEEGDSISSLTVKMYNEGYYFHALTLQMEGLETEPYYIEGDSSQPTIGVGYNVKMGLANIGQDGVEREMRLAGIDKETIDKLTSPDKKISSTAFISVEQALALLDVTYERFENSTKSAVGDAYDNLPDHRKAALVWLDYNSNIHKRPKLLRAVRQGNVNQAMEEMGTWITVHGKRQESPKVPVIRHLYHSASNMYEAIMNPSLVKRRASSNLLAWQTRDENPVVRAGVENNKNNLENTSTVNTLNENDGIEIEQLPFQSQDNLRRKLMEQRNESSTNNTNTPAPGIKHR